MHRKKHKKEQQTFFFVQILLNFVLARVFDDKIHGLFSINLSYRFLSGYLPFMFGEFIMNQSMHILYIHGFSHDV